MNCQDRRCFVASLVAASAGGSGRLDVRNLSAVTDEIGATFEDALVFARRHGLTSLEIRTLRRGGELIPYERLPLPMVREQARILADLGIGVSFLNSSLLKFTFPGTEPVVKGRVLEEEYAKEGLTPERLLARRRDDLLRVIDTAMALGTRKVRAFAFWRVRDPEGVRRQAAAILDELAEISGRSGVRILVENEAATNVATASEAAHLFSYLRSAWIGLNWDPQNSTGRETPFPAGYSVLPKQSLWNVQAKTAGLLPGKQWLDWKAILTALAADGYSGKVGLETHMGDGNERYRLAEASMRELVRIVKEIR